AKRHSDSQEDSLGLQPSLPSPNVVVSTAHDGVRGGDRDRFARRTSLLFAARSRFRKRRNSDTNNAETVRRADFWREVKPVRKSSHVGFAGRGANRGALTMATLRA
ncbi:unnamed protein product, partial [Sphacelaria rigidula]